MTAPMGGDPRDIADLADLSDDDFFGQMAQRWNPDVAGGDEPPTPDQQMTLGGFTRLRAGQAELENAVVGVQRTTAEGFQRVTARQNATDAEVNRIRVFIQSYDGPVSWAVDIACAVIIVWASYVFYLSQGSFSPGRVIGTILVDIVLVGVALAITSHIRRLPDPPAPAPAAATQQLPAVPAVPPPPPAAPAAATQQLPAVPPPPPPPPAAPPQANP
jgi:hypothetical protein